MTTQIDATTTIEAHIEALIVEARRLADLTLSPLTRPMASDLRIKIAKLLGAGGNGRRGTVKRAGVWFFLLSICHVKQADEADEMCRSSFCATTYCIHLLDYPQYTPSIAMASDVKLDLSMRIVGHGDRAKVAVAAEVSVVADQPCAVDGLSLTVAFEAANTPSQGGLQAADKHSKRRRWPGLETLDIAQNPLG